MKRATAATIHISQLEEEAGTKEETKQTDSGEHLVATNIPDKNKADTAFQVEEKGDDVFEISNTNVKKKRTHEDLATAEAH